MGSSLAIPPPSNAHLTTSDSISIAAIAATEHHVPMAATEGLLIRDATIDDANDMGRLHVRAWQAGYRGVMPDEYLDQLRADERIEMWRGILAQPDHSPLLVALVDDHVVGFASFGSERTPASGQACGELYAMNVDPDQWGRSIGRTLLRRVTDELTGMGLREAVLWVVPQNERARSLYESEGWRADGGESTEDILGVTVASIRYRRPLTSP
jgi:ribosomal protein S18 acetylase RimI-like enzyme